MEARWRCRIIEMADRSAEKTESDEHGDVDAGQQGWLWRQRICGMETYEMWDYGDGKMIWKNVSGLGKY